ncbi:hypothetical protein AWN68_02685 [Roseivirga echinicomitans]|uniref:Glycosyltransferase 2-like domain-containing protein n=2 Tax=Roseivirga echinicomitans TaxID=296218 RepID=A0A150XY74_9BACT|nr:hypothetical protein AWN68_02685 [Roseivirga echinicomitans]
MELKRLLHELYTIKINYVIYIIDDSNNIEYIKNNIISINKYSNATYLGARQYWDFYSMNGKSNHSQLLGDETWNLGIARNFALDHSTLLGYEKVLFVDDDISGIGEKVIEVGFESLIGNCFVSCSLKGVEDDSIVGHIAKQVGVIVEGPKMLSGGFLFLSPSSITHRFYNIYNEDWILQLLEKEMEQLIIPYTVFHSMNQEVEWTIDKAVFQELGELAINGLFENYQALSMDYSFWGNVLAKRIKFIEKINERSLDLRNHHGHRICIRLLEWLKQLDGHSLQKSLEQKNSHMYFSKSIEN